MKYIVQKRDYSKIETGNIITEISTVITEIKEISDAEIAERFEVKKYGCDLWLVAPKGTEMPINAYLRDTKYGEEICFSPENWSDDFIEYSYGNTLEEAIEDMSS